MKLVSTATILSLNLISTVYMTGLIWFVQVVHYPLLAKVSSDRFEDYEWTHQILTTIVVLPPMMVEAITSLCLAVKSPGSSHASVWLTGLLLVIIVWLSTFLIQMPLHMKLLKGYDETTIRRLVMTNWIRTVTWTLRSILLGAFIWSAQFGEFTL